MSQHVSDDSAVFENGAAGEEVTPLPLGTQLINFVAIVLPFAGFLAAIIHFWGWGIDWPAFSMLIVMYVLTVLGITVGFHRLFTHRAFETSGFMQGLFAILGSMAMQGPLFKWVATHRYHHQYSDTQEDPHSPHTRGTGLLGVIRGAWHSHMGWFFEPDPPNLNRYIKDLSRSRMLQTISDLFPLWVFLGLALPALIGGLITMSWTGALLGLVWGGFARLFLVHHVTWSINSVCHMWGSRPHKTRDLSRNNFIFGILALGEGWHNNHHAFPVSARHGLKWWQVDLSWYLIRVLAWLKLARNVRLPSSGQMAG